MSKKEEILRKVAEMETKEKMVSRIYEEIEGLVKVFEKKESREALTEIGKTDKETWGLIRDSVTDLKDFVGYGGITRLKEGIVEQMELSFMQPLAPLINEFAPLIGDIFEAFEPIFPYIVNAITWIVDIIKPVIEWIAGAIQWLIDFFTTGWEMRSVLFMDWEQLKSMLYGEGEKGEPGERITERPPRFEMRF